MPSAALELLVIPVAVWAVLGLFAALSFRRSGSTTVFRLTAVFLAFWAVFATTALCWVVVNGGWTAAIRLVDSPLLLFSPTSWSVWVVGGAGAFVVFLTAFLLSQAVGRGFLRLYPSREIAWPAGLAPPTPALSLRMYHADDAAAFAFTLLEVGGPRLVRRRDVVMVSDRLFYDLDATEWQAVLAHELAHLEELDGRYLTFFRTLARLMRWDPLLAYAAESLTRREEYRADLDAVEVTRRPRALARALYKAAFASSSTGPALPGLLGVGGARGRRQALERIRRLVLLADSGEFPEDVGA